MTPLDMTAASAVPRSVAVGFSASRFDSGAARRSYHPSDPFAITVGLSTMSI